jgi:hypothetical protein
MSDDGRGARTGEHDHAILLRMLEDARRLSASNDPLLAGQYRHLEGRVAALVELTAPVATSRERRPS